MSVKEWALITGASSGLGAEFAKQLADRGYALILTARREERLKELADSLLTECEWITADLSKEEECLRLVECLHGKTIAVFINNAGFGDCGAFADSDLKKEQDMIRVNVEAMQFLLKHTLTLMKERDKGYILNVASSAGLLPGGPYMAAYYASKAYVTSLTEAVAVELKEAGSGIYVGCLCPGPVDTEFNSVANVQFALKGIRAEDCVRYALKRMFQRKVVIIPTLLMKGMVVLSRLFPRQISLKITGRQQKKKIYGKDA